MIKRLSITFTLGGVILAMLWIGAYLSESPNLVDWKVFHK